MEQRLSGAIIAAGKGERLRDAAGGVPKPLVRLGDETLWNAKYVYSRPLALIR